MSWLVFYRTTSAHPFMLLYFAFTLHAGQIFAKKYMLSPVNINISLYQS